MKDNIGLQFVDTNILVCSHDISAGRKHEIAKKLLKDLWNTRNSCLNTQVLSEFYVTITKKMKRPLSSSQASQIISDLGLWKLDIPNVEDILDAIQISQRYMISFWNSLIVCSAINLDCSIIWIENLNSGQYFDKVKVVNPFL